MVQPCLLPQKHQFDKKFKTVISVRSTPSYLEMIDWVNSNSHGSVDVWFTDSPEGIIIDVAFTDLDDALIFRIKYGDKNVAR